MKRIVLPLFIALTLGAFSQQSAEKKNGWHLLDVQADRYMGISLDKAYGLLKGRTGQQVIVAVIDSGIDTAHEDLRPVLWRNSGEIGGNGKDDDGNGYADDIYGWNFCGSRDGENLSNNSHEVARVFHNWRSEFENAKENKIPADRKFLYGQWLKAAEIINRDYENASKELPEIRDFVSVLTATSQFITEHTGKTDFNRKEIEPLVSSKNEKIAKSAELWLEIFERGDPATRNTAILKELSDYQNMLENQLKRKDEKPVDTRGALAKDNYLDINDRFYGNNNLKAHSGDHGTSVAGIIAAVRRNGIGADGIADNVRIMAIRAVPGGDEHDKDVALAIRYAVDNGASIINMSFGKPVSPYKQFVDDAVRYAASKGVLLVHGAGNDGKDITTDLFYPNPVYLDGSKAPNYITVGASGDETTGGIVASFSNYSSKSVDIFAPGTHIHSTATDNRYSSPDGTSMAAPVVSGVAAILKSYFPALGPEEIIRIITSSGKPVDIEVLQPGEEKKTLPFNRLSASGRIVNAYEAVRMALEMEKGKNKMQP